MATKNEGMIWELSLREKLMRIQTELKAPKNLYNKFGGYKYRNAEGIMEALKPFEKLYGITTIISDEIIEVSGRFYVKAVASIMDLNSDQIISSTAYAREDETKKGMDGSQITGASSSYARKYALNALYLLDDSKDADSDEYHRETSGNATEAKSEPQKASPAQATAKSSHTKEEIKAKYQELITFCKEHGYDLKSVCSEYKLNAKSSFEDFELVLRRLAYNLAINSKSVSDLIEDSGTAEPYEIT